MKIGHFISNFPNLVLNKQVYGAGRVAYNLCKELASKGHTIYVFVPFSKSIVENYKNINIYFYNSFLRIGIMNISYKLFFNPLRYDLDITHVHNDTPISVLAGLRYAKQKKNPLVITWHGDWVENYGIFIRRIGVLISNKFIVSKILSEATIIVTPSKYYVNESRFLKKYKEKIVEIPNGINLEDFNISYSKEECRNILGINCENVILFLSAIYSLKGPHILIKAIKEIIKKYRDIIFIFVGGGKIKKYKKLAEELKVQKYVKFIGYIKDDLKSLYYKAADIFVLPSIETFESFGIVNLEAMACGTPIVASKIGGIPDVVRDGNNGLLVPPKDPKALADAIIYLLQNEDVRKKMSKNAKKIVRNYSWEVIADKYEQIYRECIS